MGKSVIEYFASRSAAILWFGMSFFFCFALAIHLTTSSEEISVVKIIFFVTDLFHFWLPIFACKYLYRISHADGE